MAGGWGGLLLTALAVYLITNLVLSFFNGRDEPTIAYTEFSKQVTAGNVSKIYSKGDAIQGQLKKEAKIPGGDDKYTKFVTQRPAFADDNLWAELVKEDVTVTAQPVVQQRSFLANLLISLAPMLLLVLLWVFIARRMSGGSAAARWAARPRPNRSSWRAASAPPSRTWPGSTRSRANSTTSSTS